MGTRNLLTCLLHFLTEDDQRREVIVKSQTNVIRYQPKTLAVLFGWEGNRRSGVTRSRSFWNALGSQSLDLLASTENNERDTVWFTIHSTTATLSLRLHFVGARAISSVAHICFRSMSVNNTAQHGPLACITQWLPAPPPYTRVCGLRNIFDKGACSNTLRSGFSTAN